MARGGLRRAATIWLATVVTLSVALPAGLAAAAPDGSTPPTSEPPPTTATTEPDETAPDETVSDESTPPTTDGPPPETSPTTTPDDAEPTETTSPEDEVAPPPVSAPPPAPEPEPTRPEPTPEEDTDEPAGAEASDPDTEIQATTAAGRTWANGCITHALKPGDSGRQVGCLKRRLRRLNFPVDKAPYFGYRTTDAVKQIKRNTGRPNTGYTGAKALNRIFDPNRKPVRTWGNCITRAVRPNTKSYQVGCLKRRLRRLNFPVDKAPYFGYRAIDAVKQIKRNTGRPNTGYAGAKALNRIFSSNREPVRTWGNCITRQLRSGARGYQVKCLQRRLRRLNLLATVDGHYGARTTYAVDVIKRRNGLWVDGIASAAMMTGAFNNRDLPPPVKAGHDTRGNRLSRVAVAGPRAPLPPSRSGSGRRIVYSRGQQRAWAIDRYGLIIRSWRVSGSLYDNEPPGTHRVYSRSRYGTAYTGSGMLLPYMVRWHYTPKGNHIGFHEIPRNSSGTPIQSVWELGQRRSAGCTRQAHYDAVFLWNWAPIGTKVVVV